jgi:hypothetical protein
MKCEACERGDCHECGMQTWCECDCGGPDDVGMPPNDPYEGFVFTHCNDCGRKLHTPEEDAIGLCEVCANL